MKNDEKVGKTRKYDENVEKRGMVGRLKGFCCFVGNSQTSLVLQSRGCEDILEHLFASTFGSSPYQALTIETTNKRKVNDDQLGNFHFPGGQKYCFHSATNPKCMLHCDESTCLQMKAMFILTESSESQKPPAQNHRSSNLPQSSACSGLTPPSSTSLVASNEKK